MKILKSPEGNFAEMTLFLHHQTSKAVLVSESGNKKDGIWIPKSQIESYDIILEGEYPEIELIIPEWLAMGKELI